MGPATDVRRLDAAIDQRDLGPPADAHGAPDVAVLAQPRHVAAEAHESLLGRSFGLRRSLRGLRRGGVRSGSAMLDSDAGDGAALSQHEECAHDRWKAGQAVTVRRGEAHETIPLTACYVLLASIGTHFICDTWLGCGLELGLGLGVGLGLGLGPGSGFGLGERALAAREVGHRARHRLGVITR